MQCPRYLLSIRTLTIDEDGSSLARDLIPIATNCCPMASTPALNWATFVLSKQLKKTKRVSDNTRSFPVDSGLISLYLLDAVRPQNPILLHRKDRDTELLRQPLRSTSVFCRKRRYSTTCLDLPLWSRAKETSLVDGPGGYLVQCVAYVQISMLTDVAIIESTVANLVRILYGAIDVINCVPKLIADTDFTLSLFALLNEIQHQDWTGVPLKEIRKVELRRGVRRINSVQLNWRLWHSNTTLLSPVGRYRALSWS